jgi:hypothetical protein
LSSPESYAEQVQRLQTEFRLYDRNVDVVSAWELIFTQSDTKLPSLVRHFERFPSVPVEEERELTPDFTVVFVDDRGLVAEIANFGRDEASVDQLCEQILRYDGLTQLPVGTGALSPVSQVDVMLFVPLELGTAAVQRIINERLLADNHPYTPQSPPIIIQFTLTQDSEKYVFQRRPDPGNGNFRDEGRDEQARLSTGWFAKGDVSVKPARIREIKSARAFMNDPVVPLYLATFLWAKTFATRAAAAGESRPMEIDVVPRELAEQIRAEHGVVRAADIERAMTLLEGAKLARRSTSGWQVYWRELHQTGEDRDLADVLARRFVRPPSRPVWQTREPEQQAETAPVQERLF